MNILYFTYYAVAPSKGGTERTTTTIANGLRERGHKVYSAYASEIADDMERTEFDGRFHIRHRSAADIAKIIREHNIDVVINQGDFFQNPFIRKGINDSGTNCKLIFAHHFAPADELRGFTRDALRQGITASAHGVKNLINYLLFSAYTKRTYRQYKNRYGAVLTDSDSVVLLSKTFESEFRHFAESTAGEINCIPNALSYDRFIGNDEIACKERLVVVIARLDEIRKRIMLTLKAWQEIERDPALSDWHLIIAGDGPDKQLYENYCHQNLHRVELPGRVDPEAYYRRAAIFAMTSAREGWGLTLTESQQFGCVPIAMDSFASLRDIITDGHDGIIIPDGDVDALASAMKRLMSDEKLRTRIAANGIESAKRYERTNVVSQWESLLNRVVNG